MASELGELGPKARQLLALGRDDVVRRLLDEAAIRELALGASNLTLECLAAGGATAYDLLEVDCVRGAHMHGTARNCHRGDRRLAVARGGVELEARQASDVLDRALVASGLEAARDPGRGGGVDAIAIAPQGGDGFDDAVDLGLGLGVDAAVLDLGPALNREETAPVGPGQERPDLLGDERKDRLSEHEHAPEPSQRGGREVLGAARLVVQARLDELEVPVAHLAPDERIQLARGVRELVALDELADALGGALEARKHPAVLGRRRRESAVLSNGGRFLPHGVADPEQDEPRRVPELVG